MPMVTWHSELLNRSSELYINVSGSIVYNVKEKRREEKRREEKRREEKRREEKI